MKKNSRKDPSKKPASNKPGESIPADLTTYMTPAGFSSLQGELTNLLRDERPKLVETIRWAASNGDRSENADYIYGKKRLRAIDSRIRYLTKRIENAKIVDPNLQKGLTKVFFGATVTYMQQDGVSRIISIVGVDEADITTNKISYTSPVARALIKSEEGDTVEVKTPKGYDILEIVKIKY